MEELCSKQNPHWSSSFLEELNTAPDTDSGFAYGAGSAPGVTPNLLGHIQTWFGDAQQFSGSIPSAQRGNPLWTCSALYLHPMELWHPLSPWL